MKNKKQLFFSNLKKKSFSLSFGVSLVVSFGRQECPKHDQRSDERQRQRQRQRRRRRRRWWRQQRRQHRGCACKWSVGWWGSLPGSSSSSLRWVRWHKKGLRKSWKKLHGWSASTRSCGGWFYKLSSHRLECASRPVVPGSNLKGFSLVECEPQIKLRLSGQVIWVVFKASHAQNWVRQTWVRIQLLRDFSVINPSLPISIAQ